MIIEQATIPKPRQSALVSPRFCAITSFFPSMMYCDEFWCLYLCLKRGTKAEEIRLNMILAWYKHQLSLAEPVY